MLMWISKATATAIRQLMRIVANIRGIGCTVRHHANGIDIIVESGAGGDFLAEVIEVHEDHLVCRKVGWDAHLTGGADGSEQNFPVLKPWELRQTPFADGWADKDGETYTGDYTDEQTRTVTRESDSTEEDQVITPQYVPRRTDYRGSIIRVCVRAGGDTGEAEDLTGAVQFEDRNNAGRAWAKVSE